jgi:hypothetical protein
VFGLQFHSLTFNCVRLVSMQSNNRFAKPQICEGFVNMVPDFAVVYMLHMRNFTAVMEVFPVTTTTTRKMVLVGIAWYKICNFHFA